MERKYLMKMGNMLTREDKTYNDLKWSLSELEIGLSILKKVKEKMIEKNELDSDSLNEEIINIELKINEINNEINTLQSTWRRRKDEGMEEYTEQLMFY